MHVAHEPGQLAGIVDVEQEVVVIRREHVAATTDFVETLGPSQDADDDLVERRPASPALETELECSRRGRFPDNLLGEAL